MVGGSDTSPITTVVRATAGTTVGRVLMTGERVKTNGPEPRSRTLSCFALVRVTAGEGSCWDSAAAPRRVRAGDVLLLRPGVVHGYGPDEDGYWAEQFCTFEGRVFELWAAAGLLPRSILLGPASPGPLWDETFDALLDPRSGTLLGLRAVCMVQTLLATVADRASPPELAEEDAWVAAAKRELRRVATSTVNLDEVAAGLGLSTGAFRRRFGDAVGVSPGRFRALARVDMACELLATTDLTHRRIAERLGFADEAHFSKRFKALAGTSPSDFRAALPG